MSAADPRHLQLQAERIRHIYRNGAFVAVIVVVVAGMVALALWPIAHHARIAAWLAVVAAIQAAYLGAILVFRARPPADGDIPRWALGKLLHATALGLAWGLGAVALHRPEAPETAVYLALAIAGPTAASTSSNAFHPPSLFAFPAAAILPFVAYLLRMDDRLSLYFAGGLVFHWLFLCATGLGQVRAIREAILLRFEKEDLVAALRREKEELELARAGLVATGREKARFFAAANHDLRQPLHALGLYAALLAKDPAAPERRDLVRQVAACAESLDRLFNAMLDVYRADTARERVMPSSFPAQALLDQLALQAAPAAGVKRLRLRTVPTRLRVRSDRAMLERILGNLIGNAIRYTERGGVLVGVRRAGGACRFVVADTGVGIAEADRERIFDEFYQAANPARDRRLGFGLGLATVRRLCEALGHPLEVRSVPGRGSSFCVTVPLAGPEEVRAAEEEAGGDDAVSAGVLLVEDDPLVRDAMARLMEDWGLRFRACADGDELLAVLDAEPQTRWHAILDYRLPGPATGLGIADRIRARADAPPVTLLTGEADPAVHDGALARGIQVLRKPLRPLRLRAALLAGNRPPAPG